MRPLRKVTWNKLETFAGILKSHIRNISTKEKTLNSRHLREGDALPPFAGTLRLYSMRFSPFAQRIALMLNAKNIDYEVINIDLVKRPKWIYSKHPRGKVPSIEVLEGVTVHESLIASEYIEDAYPERRLKSDDPLVRAKDSAVIQYSNMLTKFFINAMRNKTTVDPEQVKLFHGFLEYTQRELIERGARYLHGDKPGFVDYMIWPWFERLPLVENDCIDFSQELEKYGRLTQYLGEMRLDPAVREYLVPDEIMSLFMKQFRHSYPRYKELDKMLAEAFKTKDEE